MKITDPLFPQPQRISSAEARHRRIHLSLSSIPNPKLASSDLRDGDHRWRDSTHSPNNIRILCSSFSSFMMTPITQNSRFLIHSYLFHRRSPITWKIAFSHSFVCFTAISTVDVLFFWSCNQVKRAYPSRLIECYLYCLPEHPTLNR